MQLQNVPPSESEWECSVCGYKTRLGLAKEHTVDQHKTNEFLRVKNDDSTRVKFSVYNCAHSNCDEIFLYPLDYTNHENTKHNVVSNFICRFCQKALKTSDAFRVHERTCRRNPHSIRHFCNQHWPNGQICGREYSNVGNLNKHKLKHHNQKQDLTDVKNADRKDKKTGKFVSKNKM